MSSNRRTRTARSIRTILTTLAIGTVTTLGLALVTPATGALAATHADAPEVRVGHSIESGHLLDDIQAGRITESDIVTAAAKGYTVNGEHVGKSIDLSPKERAAADAKTADLRASLAADPEFIASMKGVKDGDLLGAAQSGKDGDFSFATGPSAAPTSAEHLLESKGWFKKLFKHVIHWFTIHLNNGQLRGLIVAGTSWAGYAICATIDISRGTCAVVSAFIGASSELFRSSNLCNSRGISIPIPDTWNSHCR